MNRHEHILIRAMEECAEVAQRVSKMMVFGADQIQQDADDAPAQNPERLTNFERVRREYADLIAVMEMAGFTTAMVRPEEIAASLPPPLTTRCRSGTGTSARACRTGSRSP